MNIAKLLVAAAAVVVVAFVGYQFLPTIASSSSQTLLASGTFKAKGAPVELEATGDGTASGER
jgi:hypothetical protein